MSEKRVVCLNCIDGRFQLPVIQWIMGNYGADYVDMITEPGMDGLLADRRNAIEGIIRNINISIEKNNASSIFVIGHDDCNGNPASEEVHKGHIRSGVARLKKDFSHIPVIGLWMKEDGKGEAL